LKIEGQRTERGGDEEERVVELEGGDRGRREGGGIGETDGGMEGRGAEGVEAKGGGWKGVR